MVSTGDINNNDVCVIPWTEVKKGVTSTPMDHVSQSDQHTYEVTLRLTSDSQLPRGGQFKIVLWFQALTSDISRFSEDVLRLA